MREWDRWDGPTQREWESDSHFAAISLSGLERNHLFLNSGGKRFDDISGISALDSIADGRGFALFDYDRDGWQDIAVVNTSAPLLEIFRNRIGDIGGKGRSIAVRLVGGNDRAEASEEFSNRDGVGAVVEVRLGKMNLVRERRGGEGFAAQNSPTLIIGIGEHPAADSLTITWPSGRVQETGRVPAGTLVTVYENPAHAPEGVAFSREAWNRATGPSPEILPGESPPKIVLSQLDEKRSQIPEFALYTTMATWCSACKRSIPQVRAIREAFPDASLGVFGVPIDQDDSPEKLAEYVEKYAPAYELLIDAPRSQVDRLQEFAIASAGDGLPASVLTNREGQILYVDAGVPTVSQIHRLIAR